MILFLALILLLGSCYFGYNYFKIEIKSRVAQVLMQYAWHKSIKTGLDQKPWKSFDGVPIFRLRIKEHNVDQIVLSGNWGQSLAFGPAFHQESNLPGDGGATILSSHRDSHGIFIKNLQKGNVIEIQDRSKQWHTYIVENFNIININRDKIIKTGSKEALLIVTCYPFDALRAGTPLRYIVFANLKSS